MSKYFHLLSYVGSYVGDKNVLVANYFKVGVFMFKGRRTWAFSYCFFVPMFSLGGAETQDSIFKIFIMH